MGYTPWSIMAEAVSEKPWTSGRPCTEISMVGFFLGEQTALNICRVWLIP